MESINDNLDEKKVKECIERYIKFKDDIKEVLSKCPICEMAEEAELSGKQSEVVDDFFDQGHQVIGRKCYFCPIFSGYVGCLWGEESQRLRIEEVKAIGNLLEKVDAKIDYLKDLWKGKAMQEMMWREVMDIKER